MKTISATRLPLLTLALMALISFASCKKDDDKKVDNPFVGEWEITSYLIDGEEQMQFTVNSFVMEYDEYSGKHGDFTWEINYWDLSSERIDGDYDIDAEDEEVEFTVNGEKNTFDFDMDGDDEMEITGILDGFRITITAERD